MLSHRNSRLVKRLVPMSKRRKSLWLLPLMVIALISLWNYWGNFQPVAAQRPTVDLLPSWNEGAVKQTIVKFVEQVSDPASKSYILPRDRIATFDNDGTLWLEKPLYVQLAFILDRIRELAPEHPEWQNQQPFQDILANDENDARVLSDLKIPEDLLQLTLETHTGMSDAAFEKQVKQFLQRAQHPRFNRGYTKLIYQPMVELINYLRLNDFQVYICSAGGIDFMRTFSEAAYRIPAPNVIGSGVQKEWQIDNGGSVLVRQPKLVEPINDRAGKPVNINRYIGKKPVIAVGNSDGDIQMLQYADSNPLLDLELLLHHDDSDREYDYDQGTESALMLAQENGWNVISMKQDFKYVFPFEKN